MWNVGKLESKLNNSIVDMDNRRCLRVAGTILALSFVGDLLFCPHSKVEESFQLQSTHDLFYHGIRPAFKAFLWNEKDVKLPYDHLQYPGVVPRTFTGPLILSSLCHVVRLLLLPIVDISLYPTTVQFFARCFLSLIIAHGWYRFACAVDQKSRGLPFVGSWLLLITTCQFHMSFYASRMLPNVFALAVILHSYTSLIKGNIQLAAALVVFGTAVFRCDLLLLLASLGLSWLFLRQLSIVEALKIGVVTGILSLLLTVPLDSVLWQRFLWPEGEVFYFNTILGKSSDWGTSPWHWYFTSAIPKSMLLTLVLVPLSGVRVAEILVALEQRWRHSQSREIQLAQNLFDGQWLPYTIPVLGFVVMYSFLGHKEMRFIFPAMPIFNLAAAVGMARLTRLAFPPSKDKAVSWVGRLGFLCGIACLILTLAGHLVFCAVSRINYPGGAALQRLSIIVKDRQAKGEAIAPLHVHIDVASAMSGVSLFGQRAAKVSTPHVEWTFEKGGYESEHAVADIEGYQQFTHLLSESSDVSPDFRVIDTIQGLPRFDIKSASILTEDYIYILERKDWPEKTDKLPREM